MANRARGQAGKASIKRAPPVALKNIKPYEPGQSGNPAGRITGSKNKLSKSFVEKLYADFERYGHRAIARCRHKFPDSYLRTIAYILPRDVNVRHGFEDFSEEQLELAANRIRALLATHGPGEDRARLESPQGGAEVIDVQAVQ